MATKNTARADLRPVLSDDSLYIGDNGSVTCGRHAGMTARYTGVALDGRPVIEIAGDVLDRMAADLEEIGGEAALRCEVPSCPCRPKREIVPGMPGPSGAPGAPR